MHHYVYKITDGNAFYIGVRSCKCAPEDDPYMGSGNWCIYKPRYNPKKEILMICATRKEAEREESRLLVLNHGNIWSRNRHRSKSKVFGHV